MSIKGTLEPDNTLRIEIDGRFDFTLHKDFRDIYTNTSTNSKISKYLIDLTNTNYMDSSALGMLLLLREYAGGESSQIEVMGCNAEIKEILEISNFDRLFKIN
ncbi:MAG: STAS domain-containing protein [Asgard group archaeon]|nr:STAS domain-containing protein [Asgard group archaeon]